MGRLGASKRSEARREFLIWRAWHLTQRRRGTETQRRKKKKGSRNESAGEWDICFRERAGLDGGRVERRSVDAVDVWRSVGCGGGAGRGAGRWERDGTESLSDHRALPSRRRFGRFAGWIFGAGRDQHEAEDAGDGGGGDWSNTKDTKSTKARKRIRM